MIILKTHRHSRESGNPERDMIERQAAVYIIASGRNGTLYVGVTSDLRKRVWEHKGNIIEGATKKYRVHQLVYFEIHDDMRMAIAREKQIKKWTGFPLPRE